MEAGVIPFGDGPAMLRLLKEIGTGTPLGRIIGSGTAIVGKVYGQTRVPVVKDQGLSAYDPRSIKGIGITYATTTMGSDHTAGYAIATNIMKVGGFVDPLKKDGQIDLSRNLQISTALIDSMGLCIFVAFPILDIPDAFTAMVDMLNAKYGTKIAGDDGLEIGKQILRTERGFNLAAGFNNKHDRLPEFFEEEPIPPHNVVWDFTGEEIDTFWNF
jgi:aldehyde:ferredoxin oxidoreductase